MAHTLHVALLERGAVRVDGSTEPLVWPRPAARRLVLLLALADRHRRRRDDLVAALVPHLPPDRAARAVSKALSQARSVLPSEVLGADRHQVWLTDGTRVRTDVDEYLERVAALLAAGSDPGAEDALSDLLGEGPTILEDDLHEDWALPVRTHVTRRFQDARRAWADHAGSVSAWAAVLAHDPFDQDAVLALAAAAGAGDREDVRRALQSCADRRAELDLPLSGELVDALARMGGSHASGTERSPVLHGRDEVRSDILARLRTGQHVAVVGPAGIGKSVLLEGVATQLQGEGWHVGRGTAMPEDRLAPLAALRSALRGSLPSTLDPLARRAGDRATDEPGRGQPSELARLADELDDALRHGPDRRLLVLDDVQWADGALQRIVVRLLSRRSDRWVLLVGGRSDATHAPLPPFPTSVRMHTLDRIDDEAAARIVRAEGADEASVPDLVRRGAGNPFFLVELARATRDALAVTAVTAHLPDRVVTLLRDRVSAVAAPARRLLEFLAVLGEDAAYDVLTAAGIPLGAGGAHLDELLRRRLVRESPAGPRLVHPLLRETVLADCNHLRRAELHERAAGALTAVRVGQPLASLRRTAAARHRIQGYREAPLPERAPSVVRDGLEAGHEARRLLAGDVAEELFAGALAAHEALLGPHRAALAADACRGWVALGMVRLERPDADGARQAFTSALALAPDDEHRARAWEALSWLPYRAGDWAGAIAVCEKGLADLDPRAELPRARLLVDLGWCQHRLGDPGGVDRMRAAAQAAEEAGDWHLAALALDRLGSALDRTDGEESLATLARARAACARTGDRALEGVIDLHTAGTLHWEGRDAEALVVIRQALDLVDAVGDAYTRSVARWVAALVHDARGDLEAALAARDEEVSLLAEWGNDRHLAAAHAHRSKLLRRLGDGAGADRAAEAARLAAGRARMAGVVDLVEDDLVE